MFTLQRKIGTVVGIAGLILSVAWFCLGAVSVAPQSPNTGMVLALQGGTTGYGVQKALQGSTGTGIFVKDNYAVITWALKNQGMAFLMVDVNNLSVTQDQTTFMRIFGIKGNLINCQDAKSMVSFMMQNGWKAITASEFMKSLSAGAANATQTISGINSSLTTFYVFWSGSMTEPEIVRQINFHEKQ